MNSWREILRRNFTSNESLALFLELDSFQSEKLIKKHPFRLNIPYRLAEKMQKGTLDDPILKQFVPLHDPTPSTSFEKDPVKDLSFCHSPKLLQKYAGRALLLCSSACAMHCRYCFRQHFPYESLRKDFNQELDQIQKDTSLKEVILSGGDPLSLSNKVLSHLITDLQAIKHLNRLRFHTRFPLGIPERIDADFLKILEAASLQVWFIIHCNHPLELDSDVLISLKKIQMLGIPVLNQAVLLKGVNDSPEVLHSLFEKMVDHGISPYYLHQLDRVDGGESFEVSEERGRYLLEEVRKKLPGYALPSYVKEIPGQPSKALI